MKTSKPETGKAVLSYLSDAKKKDSVQKMHLYGTGAVNELEEKLKQRYSMQYALCVTNATTGLMAIALALKLARFVPT